MRALSSEPPHSAWICNGALPRRVCVLMQDTGTGGVVGLVVAGIVGLGVCTPVFDGPDTSAPRIESVTLSDPDVVLGPEGTGRLKVDVRLVDDTGVLDGMLTLLPEGAEPASVFGYPQFPGSRGPAFMRLASGDRRDGVWTFTLGLDAADVGAYDVLLSPTDASDNTYVEKIGHVLVRAAAR